MRCASLAASARIMRGARKRRQRAGPINPRLLLARVYSLPRSGRDVGGIAPFLAEVYRRARTLWPLQKLAPQDDDGEAASANSELAASHVIIRIDQMKDQTLADIQNVLANGETWVLRRRNELEGVVERLPLETLQEIVQKGEKAAVLKFWRQTDSPYPASDSSGGNGSEASFLSLQSGVTNLDSFNKMLASDSTMTSAAVKAKLNKIVARSSRKLVNAELDA